MGYLCTSCDSTYSEESRLEFEDTIMYADGDGVVIEAIWLCTACRNGGPKP